MNNYFCFILTSTMSLVNLLQSAVVKYFPSVSFILAFLTKLLTLGILCSTPLIFVFKAVVVTKPLVSSIFLSTFPFFSLNFVHLFCIDFCKLK